MTNLAVDDLTGDGQKEIIISTFGSVRVYNTSGFTLPGWPFFTNAGNSPPAIGDVDGDGQKEIVVATAVGPTNLYMLKANGTVIPNWPRPSIRHSRLVSPPIQIRFWVTWTAMGRWTA